MEFHSTLFLRKKHFLDPLLTWRAQVPSKRGIFSGAMEPRLTQCSQELDSNENQCALESKSQTTQINVEDGRNPCYKRRGRFCNSNAARERSRVKTLRTAFLELQQTLPAVPPDTKLSKLDVLVLATTYICHLMRTLDGGRDKASFSAQGFMHPVKVLVI